MARITTLLSSAALLAVCSQNAGAGTTMETKGNAFPPLPSNHSAQGKVPSLIDLKPDQSLFTPLSPPQPGDFETG